MLPLACRALSLVLLGLLFGVTVYRAVTQSITIDEAYTASQFVWRPLGAMAAEYDANNHVLYTLLAKLTTAWGTTDLTLRLPALVGAALFFAALYRLLGQLAGGGPSPWWMPMGAALIGANTYILDMLPLARGYGLALGLFTLGLSLLLDKAWSMAGLALGLAVTANLTLLMPVAGLLAGAVWLDRRAAAGSALTAALTAAALLAAPLWHAGREHFYFGTDSPVTSLASLMGGSLTHDWSERGGPVPGGAIVAALLLAAAVAAGFGAREAGRPLFLLASTISIGALLLAAAHYLTGLPYPYGRTGLYWILLIGAGLVGLAARFRIAAWIGAPVVLAAVWFYAAAWSTEFTTDWVYDAGTRAIAERIAARPRPNAQPVRVGASAPLSFSLNYYRLTRGWTWMAEVTRDDVRQGAYDYYAVYGPDREWAEESQHMTVLYRHKAAGSILAVR